MSKVTVWDVFDSIFDEAFRPVDRTNYSRKGNVEKHLKEGALHREDGPAVVYLDKSKENEWWLEGRKVTEEEVKKYVAEKEEKRQHIIYLRDGQPYRITGKQLKDIEKMLGV